MTQMGLETNKMWSETLRLILSLGKLFIGHVLFELFELLKTQLSALWNQAWDFCRFSRETDHQYTNACTPENSEIQQNC